MNRANNILKEKQSLGLELAYENKNSCFSNILEAQNERSQNNIESGEYVHDARKASYNEVLLLLFSAVADR